MIQYLRYMSALIILAIVISPLVYTATATVPDLSIGLTATLSSYSSTAVGRFWFACHVYIIFIVLLGFFGVNELGNNPAADWGSVCGSLVCVETPRKSSTLLSNNTTTATNPH